MCKENEAGAQSRLYAFRQRERATSIYFFILQTLMKPATTPTAKYQTYRSHNSITNTTNPPGEGQAQGAAEVLQLYWSGQETQLLGC